MSNSTMAKRETNAVKVDNQLWQMLKVIQAATGEKMNAIVNRILRPQILKEHKKALEILNAAPTEATDED